MSKDSRPTPQDISELTERYGYFENQNGIIRTNYEVIEGLLKETLEREEQLKAQLDRKTETEELDQKFKMLGRGGERQRRSAGGRR